MNTNKIIEDLIVKASKDPLDPKKNFEIALEYEKLGQTASAVSFYLRAAEYGITSDPLIVYSSLLKISLCIEDQNDRNLTVSNVILQAMEYLPDRPEAYLLYSRFHEKSKNWQESYTFASIGLSNTKIKNNLPADVSFPGYYALSFQKAVAAWWIGRKDESIKLFKELKNDKNINQQYAVAIDNNLRNLNVNV